MEEKLITRDELYLAEEIFLTGTAAEINPVRELDHRTIGPDKPGPTTQQFQKDFFDLLKGKLYRYKE